MGENFRRIWYPIDHVVEIDDKKASYDITLLATSLHC